MLKVRCIKVVHNAYGVVTENKLYKVYFDNQFRAYILDDRPYKMMLYGHGNYFKIEEDNKTLRDEFAIAAIIAFAPVWNEWGLREFTQRHHETVQKAYMLADTAMKVRGKNVQNN